jgi:UDP-glucose 4-epimerase
MQLAFREPRSLAGIRCAVLGAGGFLGGALANELCARGATVHAYGRNSEGRAHDPRIVWTSAPFSDVSALARMLDGQQIVYHLIASSIPETSNRDPAGSLTDDVHATLKLLDLCKGSGVSKIVFPSSGGTVYGIPARVPTGESEPTNPISAYGINKLAIEKYLALYRHLHGIDYVVFRISNAYGPGQSPRKKQGVIASIIDRALRGLPIEVWGTGDVTRDFVHVDDIVSGLLLGTAYDGDCRIMNLGSGTGLSINGLLAEVQRVLDLPDLHVIRTPARAADVPVSTLDTSTIARELGWRPKVDLATGIAGTADWIRSRFQLA